MASEFPCFRTGSELGGCCLAVSRLKKNQRPSVGSHYENSLNNEAVHTKQCFYTEALYLYEPKKFSLFGAQRRECGTCAQVVDLI